MQFLNFGVAAALYVEYLDVFSLVPKRHLCSTLHSIRLYAVSYFFITLLFYDALAVTGVVYQRNWWAVKNHPDFRMPGLMSGFESNHCQVCLPAD